LDNALALIKSGELIQVAKEAAANNALPYFGEGVEHFENY
jgi:histidine ammonia-lyase